MKISMFRASAAAFAAALLALIYWTATPNAGDADTIQVAQATPTDAPSDNSATANPQATTAPADQNMNTSPGVPTYNGKPAGTDMLNDNPNGAGWLSKFARNPGPDTSNMNARTHYHVMRPVHKTRPPIHP